MPTIRTSNNEIFVVKESMMQARNKFRKAVSNGDPLVQFTSSEGIDLLIATSHIVAIEGRMETPREMAERVA